MKNAMYVGVLCLAVLAAAVVTPWVVSAQQAAPAAEATPATCMDMKAAHTAMKAALQKAEELGSFVSVAVADSGADLKAFIRMDGAALAATDVAMAAAKGAASEGIGKTAVGLEGTSFTGASAPVRTADGKLIGAVGVSGCSAENNKACAEAAAAALGGGAGAAAATDDKAQIMEGLKLFKEGMENKDIEKLKSMLSDSFSHYEFGGKDSLIQFVQMTMSQGDLDNAEVDLEYAEIKIEGDTATVYPVEMVASFGSATIEFKLKKEASGWRVVGMEMEGV